MGTENRDDETPQQTAARIRKFIYYKIRKKEIFKDWDAARRMGDIGINQEVLERVYA